jgi:hypothetical protein
LDQNHLGKQRLDYPTPRCQLGQQLKGLASSMIDVSDGLAQYRIRPPAIPARNPATVIRTAFFLDLCTIIFILNLIFHFGIVQILLQRHRI